MWEENENLLIFNLRKVRTKRVIGFDLDSTIIKTKSGKKYATSKDDWVYNYDNVQKKIKNLPDDIYVIIVSNQKGLKTKVQKDNYKYKIEHLDLGRKFTLFATLDDAYRKPSSAIFEKYIYPMGISSFLFVGDAAGRKGDFADSDRMFAENIRKRFSVNVYFRTPEEFFNITTSAPQEIIPVEKFNPQKYLNDKSQQSYDLNPIIENIKSQNVLVIMVGAPASGKSSLAKILSYKTGADILNNDSQTARVVQKRFAELITDGKLTRSVIIDNTNPDDAARTKFIEKVTSGPILIILMPNDKDLIRQLYHCRIRAAIREDKPPILIPDVAYNVYYKKYSRPIPTNRIQVIDYPFSPKFSDTTKLDFLENY